MTARSQMMFCRQRMAAVLCAAMFFLTVAMQASETLAEAAKRLCPKMDTAAMLDFYRKNAPDLLEVLDERHEEYPTEMDSYLVHLAEHYEDIQQAQAEDKVRYDSLMEQLKLQMKVRKLTLDIRSLSNAPDGESAEQRKTRLAELLGAQKELCQLLEEVFDDAQKWQEVEINRLESEVKDLRRVATERHDNKEAILKERYQSLTGQEWPSKDKK